MRPVYSTTRMRSSWSSGISERIGRTQVYFTDRVDYNYYFECTTCKPPFTANIMSEIIYTGKITIFSPPIMLSFLNFSSFRPGNKPIIM